MFPTVECSQNILVMYEYNIIVIFVTKGQASVNNKEKKGDMAFTFWLNLELNVTQYVKIIRLNFV